MENILINNNETQEIQNKYPHYNSVKNGFKIPNIIHMTFYNHNLPLEIQKIILKNKQICNGCEFKFYDDNDCKYIIKTHFNDRIYSAYLNINDNYGAMKADFFRYCILYLMGGIYIDIKSSILFPIFKIIQKDDICVLDIPRNNLESWRINFPTYEQWLLIFAPNHPYLKTTILQMVNYIENRYEPKILGIPELNTKSQILHVTGPDAFTKAVNETIKQQGKLLHSNIDYNQYFKICNGLSYKNMYKINNKKHYSEINEPLYK
jgi:mannosyltransferase OCH1-like enzyme